MLKYTVILIPIEEGGYCVNVPFLPEVCTQGDTRDEAIAMAKEAIELTLECLKDDGEKIPVESGLEYISVEVNEP
jgi:antitoxin HicB